MLASLFTAERVIKVSANADLKVAESIFDKLFEQRFYQLSESVYVLADDFGFRGAVATGDSPTIESALINHSRRADASIAVFIDKKGGIAASTLDISEWLSDPAWVKLSRRVQKNNFVLSVYTTNNRHYQVVFVPVMAPQRVGWLMMGFTIDDTLAREFRNISGLHISIFENTQKIADNIISTLDENNKQHLIEKLQSFNLHAPDNQSTSIFNLEEEKFLSRIKPLDNSTDRLFAVLQKSLYQELAPYRELKKNLISILILTLSLAVILGLIIGNNMMKPVQKLAEAAERIGEGNYSIKLPIESSDEIGRLGVTLNTMQVEIAEREKRIVHQAHHDNLTELPNRYLAHERIENAVDRGARNKTPFTIIMLDLARFKQINDSLGHHIGDVALIETARRLSNRLRKSDTAARLGGDDFLLLLENTSIESAIRMINDTLSLRLTSPIKMNEIEMSLGFHYGLVEYPRHGDSANVLLRRCEIAMYEAKEKYESIVVYETGRDENHLRQLAIVKDIDEAMRSAQLQVYYQPKIQFDSGRIRHAEALVRWIHPEYGFIPPDEFIPILEQTGNIHKLTNWVVQQSAHYCRLWTDNGLNICISINLSALDLSNPMLPQVLTDNLQQYRLPPSQFTLEITESTIMHDPVSANQVLEKLQKTGFMISIDDFGTGYSSLAQLKILPVDELKIDKSFVLTLAKGSPDAVIVKSTIELAHSMGLKVVAEGVETKEGLLMLKSFNCDTGQGYFFCKPLPAAEFEQWCKSKEQNFLLPDVEAI